MTIKKKDILDKLAEEVDKIKEEAVSLIPKKIKKVIADKNEEDLSPMAVLLEENPVKIPQVGDVLEGVVIDITSNSLLLDLGALGTGIVLGKEIKDGLAIGKVKKGDKVGATLIDLENEDGYIELSIREASYERAWDDLESKRDAMGVVTTKVLDANKGGLMVEVNGITGFVPVSQLSSEHYPRVEDGDKNKILELLKKLVGKEMLVRILDADRTTEKLIVSERAASSEKEKEVISQLQSGDTIEGEISGVVDFGAFVKFLPPAKMASDRESDKLEGLVHISELAWQLIDDPRTIVKTGDKVKAKIIGIDDTRISLSMKALAKDPWSEIAEKYKVGDTVQGKIDKINPFGAFVYLDKDIHGLAHVSEFQDVYPGKKMDDVLHAGETYDWKILSIEPKDHRMGLIIVKEEK
ncbi:MAG: RNA binding S1 domain protein [Candidatus Moranbacteria bacterium GW2011_GWE1_36_7]|nr:MAG: RNA binding S1 domain protein [Candidatus Moranbacteria bacterium GW2011_GWE2_36_40]KKQ11554.1 MAG: RNA binding S1 domain protein [Candidatus Moranbacteria bacterium GW2011_GWE1_36_7]